MQFQSDNLYVMPQIKALFKDEAAVIKPLLSEIYGQCGLSIDSGARGTEALSAPKLGALFELHRMKLPRLSGAVVCAMQALPFASESLDLVLVQHAMEEHESSDAFAAEIARVLAPEGAVLILGFNPLSLWRPWLALKARHGAQRVQPRAAKYWQRQFIKHDMDAVTIRYIGSLIPGFSHSNPHDGGIFPLQFLARLRAAYLLFARKRRMTLTPIRLRSVARPLNVRPHLAAGTHRVKS